MRLCAASRIWHRARGGVQSQLCTSVECSNVNPCYAGFTVRDLSYLIIFLCRVACFCRTYSLLVVLLVIYNFQLRMQSGGGIFVRTYVRACNPNRETPAALRRSYYSIAIEQVVLCLYMLLNTYSYIIMSTHSTKRRTTTTNYTG